MAKRTTATIMATTAMMKQAMEDMRTKPTQTHPEAPSLAREMRLVSDTSPSLSDILNRLVFLSDNMADGLRLTTTHEMNTHPHQIMAPFSVASQSHEHKELVRRFVNAIDRQIDARTEQSVYEAMQRRNGATLTIHSDTPETEFYETLKMTIGSKSAWFAFDPQPDITAHQYHLCRKMLDGLIYTPSKLLWLMDRDLMVHFKETVADDSVEAASVPDTPKRKRPLWAEWTKGLQVLVVNALGLKE